MFFNAIKLVGAIVLVTYVIVTMALEWRDRLEKHTTIKKFVEAKALRASLLIVAIILLFGVFQDINAVREALNVPPPSPKAPPGPIIQKQEPTPDVVRYPVPKPDTKPPIQINNAPNGIAIGGGTVSNPTVNNFGERQYPLAGQTPTISICGETSISRAYGKDYKYETIVSLETDTRITRPAIMLYFDGTVLGTGNVIPQGFGHFIQGGDKNPRFGAENTFVVYVMEIGSMSEKSWYPNNLLKLSVFSLEPRILQKVEIQSGLAEDVNAIQPISYQTKITCPIP